MLYIACETLQPKVTDMSADADPAPRSNTLDPELLEILRCPLTLSRLRQEGDWLVAEEGGMRYPVRDGIAVLLMEEAHLPPGKTLEQLKAQYQQ